MDKYNLFQQIYCLSVAANIAAQHEGSEETLEIMMRQTLDKVLPVLAGQWAVSWGPRVFKEKDQDLPNGGPDNVWYAALDETQKVCVVGIAGTAPYSSADNRQNCDVYNVVDFNAWVKQWSSDKIPKPETCDPDNDATAAYCAEGTCIGVWNILSNSGTAADEGMRIDQYLSRLDKSYTIVVTGHSLGGVLSPIVALGLRTADVIGAHDIKALPSAGVSPGNAKLALDYAESFPKTPETADDYQVYNTVYYNEFDTVPQAWSISEDDDRNLSNILGRIFHLSGGLEFGVEVMVGIAERLSKWSGIQYTPLPGQKFTGPQPPDEFPSWDEVKATLGEQHTLAYWDKLGITEFVNLFERKFRGCRSGAIAP